MPIEYEVSVQVRGPLADSREAVQIMGQEVHRGMATAVAELERRVRARTPGGVFKDAGLRGSIAGEVRGRGLDVRGVVGSPLPYAAVVELGRRAGAKQPPPGALDLWVKRILGVQDTEVRRVAFLVSRAIARRGIPGRFMFRDALASFRPQLSQIFEEVGAAIARRLGGR
jgi:hypothetical protein